MDKQITQLIELDQFVGDEYVVVASEKYADNYKVKAKDLVGEFVDEFITVDDHLSETSINPVLNRVITAELKKIDTRLDNIDGGNNSESGSGSGSSNYNFNLAVASVETETLEPGKNANVRISDLGVDNTNTKNLAFKFSIPRGASGEKGESGTSSIGGITVFAFKSSDTSPDKPVGGKWNSDTNTMVYPSGWSPTDNLIPPIWMSNATFNEHGIVIDWSIPIRITGEDGVSGTDGTTIEFIYRLFEDELIGLTPPFSDPNHADYVPEHWKDHPSGVTDKMRCEYICTRSKDIETGLWGQWSTPALWSKYGVNGKDGDSVEYIYQLTTDESIKPVKPGTVPSKTSPVQDYQEREFIPASAEWELPWTDNPSGVSSTNICEWVSVRKYSFNSQKWEEFSEPALWAKYGVNGKNGEPGTGIHILGSYDSELALNSAWSNGILSGNNPPETGDSYIVDGSIYVFDGDEFLNCGYIKGEPGDSTYLHIKYSDDGYNFTDNNGEIIGKYIGIRVDYVEQDSNIFSDYTWSRFRGNDGFGYEYIFKISTENIAPTVPTQTTETGIAPDEWTIDPTGVDSTNKYEWCCYRKSDENGNWSNWMGRSGGTYAWLFAMWAESLPGETGQPGPILYPAGVWGEESESFSQEGDYINGEWVVQSTPYVLHNGTFYVLQVPNSSNEPGIGDDWMEIKMFNAIYTDILLANNAKVGLAVFNGDYMFSQNGNGSYKDFDGSKIYKEGSPFDPAWCVNLVTGEQWAGTGAIYFSANSADTEIRISGDGYSNVGSATTSIGAYFNVDGLGIAGKNFNFKVDSTSLEYATYNGEKQMVPLFINGLTGQGSLANGAIQWDEHGNIIKYPKTNTASITGNWLDTKYRDARITITIASGYENTDSCKVVLYDYSNSTIITEQFYAIHTGETITDIIHNPSGIPCYAQLYINNELISEADLIKYGAASGSSGSSTSSNIHFLTQSEYDLITPDLNTLYVII